MNIAIFLRTYFEKYMQITASVNFRAAVFQRVLLHLLNKMPSGISWQYMILFYLLNKMPKLLEFRGNTRILIQVTFFALLTVAPFLRTQSIMMDFWFILVASIIVTWPSLFSGHRFKLESEDFVFHILQRNFSNFGIKILVRCSVRSLQSFYFSLFCSQLVYTCSKFG